MTGTIHWLTPSVSVIDSRGLAIRQVEYLRKVAVGPLETVITRQHYDVAGRLIAQWDPRLFGSAPRPNLATVHGLSGQPIKVDSVDAGWRLSLAGLAGEIRQRWDERGNWWRTTYDDLLRVLTVDENAQTNVEIFTYARADAAPGNNLRGQLCKKVDPAGSIEINRFSVQGLPLEETRTFPDGNIYTTAWSYGASGQALSQTDAGGHQQRSRYDIASQLKQVTLQIDADGPVLDILEDAQYNAAGQIIEQLAGNGVLSTWIYDPADGRLENLKAGVPGQPPRQDFEYLYDRVGNVLRIDDHTFQPVFFANQRIDGHREFTYDSLYRLTSATGHDATPPSDLPGRPLPSDPRNHLNYTQRYEYDTGGNLIELTHERDVGGYTHQMCIDPSSNRGVRWKEGDPVPDFLRLFDPHGNLQALQPGQDLHWNNRDQLASVTLVKRDDTANDEETFHYSNDVRVSKRHETHTSSTTHFHQVIYLPGLEIRTRDNGEELHVITAPGGRGSVRCLHWVSGQPDDIEPDQLRYSLDDHLGSSLIEFDQQARLISHEGYYPFGGTAWLTADSAVEVSYKTVRYSGMEMDVSGLYYYGLRYYAPWLQRWVSADPAGDVDGLNLYAFVGSNPVFYVDSDGQAKGSFLDQFHAGVRELIASNNASYAKTRQEGATRRARRHVSKMADRHQQIAAISERRAKEAQQQILNHRSPAQQAKSVAFRIATHMVIQGLGYGAGIAGGTAFGALGTAVAPGVGTVFLAAAGAFLAKKVTTLGLDFAAERTGLSASVKLKTSKLDPIKIIQKAEYKTMNLGNYVMAKYQNMNPKSSKGQFKAGKEATTTVAGQALKLIVPEASSEFSASVGAFVGAIDIIHEVNGAGAEISARKENQLSAHTFNLSNALNSSQSDIKDFVNALSLTSINGVKVQTLSAQTTHTVTALTDTRTMIHSRSHTFTDV